MRFTARLHCKGCPLKDKCTPSSQRRVTRWEHQDVLDEMQARLEQTPGAVRIRRSTVEYPYLLQAYSSRVLPSNLFDLSVEFFNTFVECLQISPQPTQEPAETFAQTVFLILKPAPDR